MLDPKSLAEAFNLFNETSGKLASAYADLERQVERLTRELAVANSELARRERLSALGEVAARLAHQLRTPLATAMLYAGHLGRPKIPDADRIRFAERVGERLRHLERLTEDMLRFVKGIGETQAAVVAAVDLAEEVARVMEPHAVEKKVGIDVDVAEPGLRVQCSRPAVLAALLSLAENAVEAAPRGSKIRISAAANGNRVVFGVHDAGPGIPEGTAERVFEPFFTTRDGGTGLGLAIVRTVAESHGGQVSFRSAPGAGTVFELALPMAA